MDHAATTALDPRVLEAMVPFMSEHYGNASSVHALGRRARFAVEESREQVAGLLGAEPGEILFTGGGTEANNLALRGSAGAVVTSAAEHESVLRTAEALQAGGRRVHVLQPEPSGAVTTAAVEARLDEDVGIVSIMHANNEVGTLSPISEIAEACRRRGARVHCDAVQTAGYGMMRVDELDVELVTISGHKFFGPKGAGVLFVRGGIELIPQLTGGSQERGRRGGTENVPAIVGLAKAMQLAIESAQGRRQHAEEMRDRLRRGLDRVLGERIHINTPPDRQTAAPHILHIAFPPVDGEALDGEMLLLNLDMEGVCASAGSACTSGAVEPSHVLQAMGLDPATAAAAVRFSVGKDTTADDVDYAVEAVERVAGRMVPAQAAR